MDCENAVDFTYFDFRNTFNKFPSDIFISNPVNTGLDDTISWKMVHRVFFNRDKCKVLHFGLKKIQGIVLEWPIPGLAVHSVKRDPDAAKDHKWNVSYLYDAVAKKADAILGIIRTIASKSQD